MFDTTALVIIALTYGALLYALHLIECGRTTWRIKATEAESNLRMKQEEVNYLKLRVHDLEKRNE